MDRDHSTNDYSVNISRILEGPFNFFFGINGLSPTPLEKRFHLNENNINSPVTVEKIIVCIGERKIAYIISCPISYSFKGCDPEYREYSETTLEVSMKISTTLVTSKIRVTYKDDRGTPNSFNVEVPQNPSVSLESSIQNIKLGYSEVLLRDVKMVEKNLDQPNRIKGLYSESFPYDEFMKLFLLLIEEYGVRYPPDLAIRIVKYSSTEEYGIEDIDVVMSELRYNTDDSVNG